MKKPTIIVLWIAGTVTVAGLAAGGWFWERSQQSAEAVSSNGGSIAIKTGESGAEATPIPMNAHDSPQANKGAVAGTTNLMSPTATPAPTTPAGLPGPAEFGQYDQYKSTANALFVDVVPGTGASVAAGSHLKVNYRGWLTNGQMFDESYGKQPFELTEGEHKVISGWEEGLFGMKAGGKRRIIVPPAFGYGAQTTGSIPANSVLVFDVELLGVQ